MCIRDRSSTRQRDGSTPSRRAARRNTSGSNLPQRVSSVEQNASKLPVSPSRCRQGTYRRSGRLVATASLTPSVRSRDKYSRAPGSSAVSYTHLVSLVGLDAIVSVGYAYVGVTAVISIVGWVVFVILPRNRKGVKQAISSGEDF